MSCVDIRTLGKQCNDCSSSKSTCTEENLAYFVSQEFVDKILANTQLNQLNTSDKSLVGALLELNKQLDLKQDHHSNLDLLSNLPQSL